jgi:hypothetical protein
MDKSRREIPPGRKAIYYVGMVISAVGALSFGSTFCIFAANFGNFDFNPRPMIFLAVGGMAMMITGGILMNLGRAGLAGSGVLLDPQKQRQDLEPWNRAAGGMVSDAVSEVEAVNRVTDALAGRENTVVKVRCPKCRALNDETAKFCNNCGAALAG